MGHFAGLAIGDGMSKACSPIILGCLAGIVTLKSFEVDGPSSIMTSVMMGGFSIIAAPVWSSLGRRREAWVLLDVFCGDLLGGGGMTSLSRARAVMVRFSCRAVTV